MSVAGEKKTGGIKCWKKYSSGVCAVLEGLKLITFTGEGVDSSVSIHAEEFMCADILKGSSWISNLDLPIRL